MAADEGMSSLMKMMVVLLIGLALIGLGVLVSASMRKTSDGAGALLSSAETEKYNKYNGQVIKGRDLQVVIKSPEVSFVVYTKKGGETNYGPAFDEGNPSAPPSDLSWDEELSVVRTEEAQLADVRNDNTMRAGQQHRDEFIGDKVSFLTALIYDGNDVFVGVLAEQVGLENGPVGLADVLYED